MIKINFKSIRGRLALSYTILSVLMLALLIFTLFQLSSIVSKGNEVLLNKQPTRVSIYGVSSGIRQSNVLLQSYMLLKQDSLKDARQQVWEKEIQPGLDSLEKYKAHWTKPEDLILYEQITRKIARIKSAQEKAEGQVNTGGGSTASLSVSDYPDIQGDTIIADDAFQSWVNDQLQSASGGDESSEALSTFSKEILPLSIGLQHDIQSFFDSMLNQSYATGDVINHQIDDFKILELVFILLALIITYLMYRYVKNRVMSSIQKVRSQVSVLGEGNLPEDRLHTDDELDVVLEEIHSLSGNLKNVKEFALEVGKGTFDTDITVFNNEGEIGHSLAEMRESLKNVAEEARVRNWSNQGFAEFSDILRKNADDLNHLSDEVIRHLVKYLKANQGGLFILNDNDEDNPRLELSSSFAYNRKKYQDREVLPGQGLVGQCYLEKESIYLKEIPEEYIRITSGLGEATPTHLFIVPLIFNEKVYGIIELASFKAFEEYEREFIERVAESIASSISTVKTNETTRELLEESQQMTEELQANEEEMRQNMEELQATQEEMNRNQKEAEEQSNRVRSVLDLATNAIISSDEDGVIQIFNHAAERIFGYAEREAVGLNVRILMDEHDANQHNQYMENYKETGKKKVLEKGRMVTGLRKDGSKFPAYLTLEEGNANGHRFFTAIIRDMTGEVEHEKALKEERKNLLKEMEEMKQALEQVTADPKMSKMKEVKGKLEKELIARLEENQQKLKQMMGLWN